jgi:hypothetical protein
MDPNANYTAVVNSLKKLDVDEQQKAIAESVDNLPESKKAETVANAAGNLTDEQKKEVAASVTLQPPTTKINDYIWLIVISSFAVVLVGTATFIAIGWYNGKTFESNLLLIFTTVSAFLIGLFAQSPVR